jgi:hypothetical protein
MKSKIVTSVEEAKKENNSVIIDLDEGVEYLFNFNKKTWPYAKKFKKLSRKFDGSNPELQKKKVLKFMKDELYNIFKNEFLDKFYKNKEYEVLDKDIIAVYIFGCFVEGHAKGVEIDLPTQFKLIIKELTDRIYEERSK